MCDASSIKFSHKMTGFHRVGSHCHVEAQMCRVTALCWAQAFNLWALDPPAASRNRPAESLLVGRSDGSLCWLQVEMHEIDLHVKSTELMHCYRKEGKGDETFPPHLTNCNKPNLRISRKISLLIGPSYAVCCLAQ